MISEAIIRLEYHLQHTPSLLMTIDEAVLADKPRVGKWSKKEILGHLVDSATINLIRFVRAQFEDNPIVGYDQDQWCIFNYYQQADITQLIKQWESTNGQLVFVWKQLPAETLQRMANSHTLAFLAEDYISHLEHHLGQLFKKGI